MWILCTVTNDIVGKKRYGAVTRADVLNRSSTNLLTITYLGQKHNDTEQR